MKKISNTPKSSSVIINDSVVQRSDKTKDRLLEEATKLRKQRKIQE